MRHFRCAAFGRFGEKLLRWPGEQRLLNVRTYVKVRDEPAICFLAEWQSSWINAQVGPHLYSLPYRWGRLKYGRAAGDIRWGAVEDRCQTAAAGFHYEVEAEGPTIRAPKGSTTEFLLERYVAFNKCGAANKSRSFRIQHSPWEVRSARVHHFGDELFRQTLPWWPNAQFVSADISEGAKNVAMSAPDVASKGSVIFDGMYSF